MKTLASTALLSAGATLALVSSASAADLSPVINEAISDVLVPIFYAVVPVVGAVIVMPLRRFLDQKAGDLLASRVDDLLDKAIAFAAKQGEAWVADQHFHVEVDNWLVNIAVDYAVSHAPSLLKQAGALASSKAGDLVKQKAADLLKQKVTARLDHPAVAALKALAPPAPVAAAA